jgi:hypothetical protein
MLENKFDDFSFLCGCDMADVGLQEISVHDLTCHDLTENLYYSLGRYEGCHYSLKAQG